MAECSGRSKTRNSPCCANWIQCDANEQNRLSLTMALSVPCGLFPITSAVLRALCGWHLASCHLSPAGGPLWRGSSLVKILFFSLGPILYCLLMAACLF